MERLKSEEVQVEEFEREVDECGHGRRNLLVRFCRKKYKCIMMFMAILASLLQTIYLIIEKTDSDTLAAINAKFPKILRALKALGNLSSVEMLDAATSTTPTGDEYSNGEY